MYILAALSFIGIVVLLLAKYDHWPITSVKAAVCPDEVNGLVLTETDRKFPQYNYLDVWLSHNYDPDFWNPKFAAEQTEIDRLRSWSKGLNDRCFRSAYADWLDYYQNDLDSAKKELKSQSTKSEMDAFDQDLRRERESRRLYKEQHEVPVPPRP